MSDVVVVLCFSPVVHYCNGRALSPRCANVHTYIAVALCGGSTATSAPCPALVCISSLSALSWLTHTHLYLYEYGCVQILCNTHERKQSKLFMSSVLTARCVQPPDASPQFSSPVRSYVSDEGPSQYALLTEI